MQKRYLLTLLGTGLLAGSLAAQSGIILVDFGNAVADPVDSAVWNSAVTGNVTDLVDTSGLSSGIGLSWTGDAPTASGLTTSWDDRTVDPDWADDSLDSLRDRLFNSDGQTGSLVLSGLDPSRTYDIELASAFQAAAGAAGATPFAINMVDANGVDADGKGVTAFNVDTGLELTFDSGRGYLWTVRTGQGSEEGWLGWFDAVPTPAGELVLNFDTTGGSLSRSAFNAMEITVPEPSTYAALFGLLALGFVAWRRRR